MTLQPGTELDELVAEKVMGWTRLPGAHPEIEAAGGLWQTPSGPRVLLPFSTDIARAWRLLDSFAADGAVQLSRGRSSLKLWTCTIWTDWRRDEGGFAARYEGDAPTAPHAICLAALKAVGAIE